MLHWQHCHPGLGMSATQHSTVPASHGIEWNWVTLAYPLPQYSLPILLTTDCPSAYSKIFLSRLCLPERHKHNASVMCRVRVPGLSDIPRAQLYARLVCQVLTFVATMKVNQAFVNIFLPKYLNAILFFH